MDNIFVDELLDLFDSEIKKHRDFSVPKPTSWDRGVEEGRMIEALSLKSKARSILRKNGLLKDIA